MITVRFVISAVSFLFWFLHFAYGVVNAYDVIKGTSFVAEARVTWSYLLTTFTLFGIWLAGVIYAAQRWSSIRKENRSPDAFLSRTGSLVAGFVYWAIIAIFMIATLVVKGATFDVDADPWWYMRLQILYAFMGIIAVFAFFEMWAVGHAYGYTVNEQLGFSTFRKMRKEFREEGEKFYDEQLTGV